MREGKKPLAPASEKQGMSTAAKFVIGCGGLLLLCIVAACGGLGYLGWWGFNKVDAFAQEFVAKGYKRQAGQVIVVPGPVEEPTVYTAQVVRIPGEVNADIAIMAQVAEISGKVNGDIEFTGQVLHIQPDAVVKGNIHIRAGQVIRVEGTVEGEITGDYMAIQRADGATAPLAPSAPVAPSAPIAPPASIEPLAAPAEAAPATIPEL